VAAKTALALGDARHSLRLRCSASTPPFWTKQFVHI
jgi:hypothetical protein